GAGELHGVRGRSSPEVETVRAGSVRFPSRSTAAANAGRAKSRTDQSSVRARAEKAEAQDFGHRTRGPESLDSLSATRSSHPGEAGTVWLFGVLGTGINVCSRDQRTG